MNVLRILVTLGSLAAFIGILWWAYAPARREDWERKGLLDKDSE